MSPFTKTLIKPWIFLAHIVSFSQLIRTRSQLYVSVWDHLILETIQICRVEFAAESRSILWEQRTEYYRDPHVERHCFCKTVKGKMSFKFDHSLQFHPIEFKCIDVLGKSDSIRPSSVQNRHVRSYSFVLSESCFVYRVFIIESRKVLWHKEHKIKGSVLVNWGYR